MLIMKKNLFITGKIYYRLFYMYQDPVGHLSSVRIQSVRYQDKRRVHIPIRFMHITHITLENVMIVLYRQLCMVYGVQRHKPQTIYIYIYMINEYVLYVYSSAIYWQIGKQKHILISCLFVAYCLTGNIVWWRPQNLCDDFNITKKNPWFSSFLVSSNPLSRDS